MKEKLHRKNQDISWLEQQCDDADSKETELREQLYEMQKMDNENVCLHEYKITVFANNSNIRSKTKISHRYKISCLFKIKHNIIYQ